MRPGAPTTDALKDDDGILHVTGQFTGEVVSSAQRLWDDIKAEQSLRIETHDRLQADRFAEQMKESVGITIDPQCVTPYTPDEYDELDRRGAKVQIRFGFDEYPYLFWIRNWGEPYIIVTMRCQTDGCTNSVVVTLFDQTYLAMVLLGQYYNTDLQRHSLIQCKDCLTS